MSRELRRYAERDGIDPARLPEVEERMYRLEGLLRQHGPTLEDVLAARARVATELEGFATMESRIGALEAAGSAGHGQPAKLGAERVHVELENAFTTEGRHFILEGGNVLTLRRGDGATVVFLGHNARTSADAIDELAYRLLREDGRRRSGRVGAVVVVDLPDPGADSQHLDTRMLPLGEHEIAVDRSLVQAPTGMGARFFVFLPHPADAPAKQ